MPKEPIGHIPLMGYHGAPSNYHIFDENIFLEDFTIYGSIDSFGHPCVTVSLINFSGPASVSVKAIVDTGAYPCLIKPHIAESLNLNPTGEAEYNHPMGGLVKGNTYNLCLSIQTSDSKNPFILPNLSAGPLMIADYAADFIIGVSLLKHFQFEYNGITREVKLFLKKDNLQSQ
jgi:predicted aspartyl protease